MPSEYNRFTLGDILFTKIIHSGQQLTVFLVPIKTSTIAKSFEITAEIITGFSYIEISALVYCKHLQSSLIHDSSFFKEEKHDISV